MKHLCGKKAQGKVCNLEFYHSGCHIDSSGFKFINEHYPNYLGNGPGGYPMNNPAFDKAAAKIIEDRKDDAAKAEEFLRKFSIGLKH